MPDRLDLEVKHSTFIRAPREKVYDAFATENGLNAWFTTGAKIDARPGGAMLFRFVDWDAEKIDAEFPGRVIEAKRPSRFVYEWGDPGRGSIVEIDFEEHEGGTLVRLREHGFREIGSVIGNATGWGEAMTLWKFWWSTASRRTTSAPHRVRTSAARRADMVRARSVFRLAASTALELE